MPVSTYTEEEVAEIRIETYFAVKNRMEEKYKKKLEKRILQERERVAKDLCVCGEGRGNNDGNENGVLGDCVYLPAGYAIRPGHVAAMVGMFERLNAQSVGEGSAVDETSYPTVGEAIEKIEAVLSMKNE